MDSLESRLNQRYKREKLYDITSKNLISWNVNGSKYKVYDNVNLSIFTTEECNANCDFCVAELRYINDGQEYIKPKIKDEATYLNRLEEMLKVVKELSPSISITGGEPSLDKRLPKILNLLSSYDVRKLTMTTNGAGLLGEIDGEGTLLDCLVTHNLKHLNISRAHFKESINDKLMNFNEDRVSNSDLEEIIKTAKLNGIRPRLSCVLLKGYIDSVDKMVEYIEWAKSIGIDNVVFRQLMQFDKKSVSQGRISNFIIDKSIDLIPIWEEMDNDKRFEFENSVLGYYYYVEVYKYRGMDIVSERADLKLINRERKKVKEQLDDSVIYELVFHPNGRLCGSWREWEEIIWE